MTRRKRSVWNQSLPLFTRAVFIDWHGVMSRARFWSTYTPSGGSALSKREFDVAVADLFDRHDVTHAWMRGELTTSEVVDSFLLPSLPDSPVQDLSELAAHECSRAPLESLMRGAAEQLRKSHQMVLATDNMDCFVDGIKLRPDLQSLFDDFVSSSEIGVLKAEDPERFFGDYMRRRSIDPSASVLIDDGLRNCVAFESLGGQAIHYKGGVAGAAAINELIWPIIH